MATDYERGWREKQKGGGGGHGRESRGRSLVGHGMVYLIWGRNGRTWVDVEGLECAADVSLVGSTLGW